MVSTEHWLYQDQMTKSGVGTTAVPYAESGVSPFTSDGVIAGKPALTAEAMGWLAYCDRRVEIGGTWHRGDAPHVSWDNITFSPMSNYYRYELTWLCFSVGVMADQTPAWRELYAKHLDFYVSRLLEYWSFFDWIEARGPDPAREKYPEEWYELLIPKGYRGKYDVPGWAGNGLNPYEYDPDPVRGNGTCNLMYKGYLELVLGMYRYVSDDGKYERPFQVVYDDQLIFEYDHKSLTELIAQQWLDTPTGFSCEVTKAWGVCNALTGLGLKMFDSTHGTHHIDSFELWLEHFRREYVGNGLTDEPIDWYTLYYDKMIDANLHNEEHQSAFNWLATAAMGLPHDRRLFERLYEGAMQRFYRPQNDGTAYLIGMPGMELDDPWSTYCGFALASELGDVDRLGPLKARMDRYHEPTWDTARGEFYVHSGLGEDWPRGQYNSFAQLGYAITKPGEWINVFEKPNLAKFDQPTVEGVDYPTVRPRQAYWDEAEQALFIGLTSCDTDRLGTATQFRVTNLQPGADYRVTIDGHDQTIAAPDGSLEVHTDVGTHTILVRLAH